MKPSITPTFSWSRRPVRAVLVPLAGAGLALAFPSPGWWPLAVPSLAVLFALWSSATPRRAAIEGFFGGAVFFGLMLRWFAAVLLVFTSLGAVVSFGAVVASGAIMGSITALVAWVIARIGRRFGQGAALFAAPLAWSAFEVSRAWFPFPFLWGTLAATWARAPGGPAVATVAGTYGLSLVLALGAGLGAAWLLSKGRRRPVVLALGVWCGLAIGLSLAGLHFREQLPATRPVRVAVLQASLPEEADPLDQLGTYEKLTADAANAGARLIVWPESAVRYRLDSDRAYRERIETLARRLDVDLVMSTVTGQPGAYYNSVSLVRADTGLADTQPKRQLVPFGEYLPMRWLFGRVPAIAWEMQEDFRPGRVPVLLRARDAGLGALVCFEGVFPGLARDLTGAGATILVDTTNDSWFGWTAGPAQHLQHTILRSAETGRPMLRAANTGISAIIDRNAQVIRELPLGDRGLLVADVLPGAAPPPGSAVGAAVSALCAIFGAAALIAAIFLRKAQRPAPAGEDRVSDGHSDA